jgi:hypothetical protein
MSVQGVETDAQAEKFYKKASKTDKMAKIPPRRADGAIPPPRNAAAGRHKTPVHCGDLSPAEGLAGSLGGTGGLEMARMRAFRVVSYS